MRFIECPSPCCFRVANDAALSADQLAFSTLQNATVLLALSNAAARGNRYAERN